MTSRHAFLTKIRKGYILLTFGAFVQQTSTSLATKLEFFQKYQSINQSINKQISK
jgi:hypothetical protein